MDILETVTVGPSGATSIIFSEIPDAYTDLFIVMSLRTTGAIATARANFNGTSTGFSIRRVQGDGSTTATVVNPPNCVGFITGSTDTANTFGTSQLLVANYRSNRNKPYLAEGVTENNGTTAAQTLVGGVWANTSPITSIEIYPDVAAGTLLAQYSSASLYGITAGSDGIVGVA